MRMRGLRRGPDGSVFVQTLGCGIERITDIGAAKPRSKLAYQFPGSNCEPRMRMGWRSRVSRRSAPE